MFSCNNQNGSILCDQTFWIVVIAAIIILWVHYNCNSVGGSTCGCNNNTTNSCNDYCC